MRANLFCIIRSSLPVWGWRDADTERSNVPFVPAFLRGGFSPSSNATFAHKALDQRPAPDGKRLAAAGARNMDPAKPLKIQFLGRASWNKVSTKHDG